MSDLIFDIQLFADISNLTSNTVINGTDQAEKIINTGNNVTINAFLGNDTITNISNGENIYINAGDGNNQINNLASNAKIKSGSGNDTIKNYKTTNISIDAGEGDNNIINDGGDYFTIKSGTGNDTVIFLNHGSNIFLDVSDGDNYVQFEASNSTLKTGNGNDRIFNHNDINLSINAGAGNDSIHISDVCYYGTINGGSGNDTIDVYGQDNLVQYANGDGNDFIYGLKAGDTLQISGAKYTTTKSGSDLIIGVGSGKITLVGAANFAVNIDGTLEGGGTDTTPPDTLPAGWKFTSTLASATLTSADDLDLNEDYGANIKNVNAASITGGVIIYGNDLNNSIKGSKGADEISGGAGNDTVSLGAGDDTYIYSGGNDLIQDYKAGEDVIKFETAIQSASLSSSNLIIKTAKGNVTVKSGKDKNITVVDSNDETLTILNEYPVEEITTPAGWKFATTLATATLTSADDLDLNEDYGTNIKNVNAASITGGVVIYGNDLNNSIKGGKGADEISGGAGNDTVSLGGGKDTYIYSSGNDLITDYKAGEDVIKFETRINSATLNGSNLIITTDEGKLTIKNGKDKNITVIDSNDETLTIVNEYPAEEITLPEGWKFGTSSKTNTNAEIITATLKTAEDIDLTEDYGAGVETVDSSKLAYVEIIGNNLDNSIKGSKGADIIAGGGGNDTVSLGAGMDVYVYSGGNDVVQDYLTGVDSIKVEIEGMNYTNANEFMTSIISGQNVIFQTSEGDLTVVKNNGKKITLMDENNIEISLGGELPDGWKFGTSSKSNTNAEIITATVKGAENIDLSESYGENVETVDGSKTSGVEIFGNDLDNSIKGGAGNNTLGGGAGDDILVGNTGADVFVYSEGDDRIINYVGGSGKDSIQIDIDNILKNTTSKIQREIDGEDVIYYIDGAGILTVQDAKDQKIKLMDSNGVELILTTPPKGWKLDSSKNLLQASVASADNEIYLTEAYGENVQKVDGSKISGGVEIYGNDLNNSIKSGKGNDILDGGAGNDTLTSGAGDDLFIYTGGDDYITDYTANKDSIQVDINEIEIYSMETVGSDVVYATDAGNITVKSGKGKEITLIDADGEEIIIGGGKIPEGWKFDSTKNLLQATVAGADNYIDLSENYGAGVEKVDGSKISGVEIYGNDLDNSIKGGKGNDILDGGAGNDTMTGGAGADTYVYTGGDDLITDYATVDSIQFDTINISITNRATVGSNVVFTTDAGTLTVKSAKTKKITLLDSDGEEFTYTKSSKNVAEDILSRGGVKPLALAMWI